VDFFTYTIWDGSGGTDTATVTVTIEPVADAPIAYDVFNRQTRERYGHAAGLRMLGSCGGKQETARSLEVNNASSRGHVSSGWRPFHSPLKPCAISAFFAV
jgi:hypothetical protein